MSDFFANERERVTCFRQALLDIYGIEVSVGEITPSPYQTDGHASTGNHVYLIIEAKNEINGGPGAEPFCQAGLYHHEHTKLRKDSEPGVATLKSHLPCFQVVFFGMWPSRWG